ncbi:MAG: HPr family phosphocarrier protein, partial [Planctomycetia bacterium]
MFSKRPMRTSWIEPPDRGAAASTGVERLDFQRLDAERRRRSLEGYVGSLERGRPSGRRAGPAGGDPMNPLPAENNAEPTRLADDHFRCEVVVVNEVGLHVRPASMLVELGSKQAAEIR